MPEKCAESCNSMFKKSIICDKIPISDTFGLDIVNEV